MKGITAALALALGSASCSYIMDTAKPQYSYKPSVVGIYYSTLAACAGQPQKIVTVYPLQTWQYPDCTVTLDANHVSSTAGTCATVAKCR